jgi:hypothetical protein
MAAILSVFTVHPKKISSAGRSPTVASGCANRDIKALFEKVKIGTSVIVIAQLENNGEKMSHSRNNLPHDVERAVLTRRNLDSQQGKMRRN